MAESGGIVITVSTKSSAYIVPTGVIKLWLELSCGGVRVNYLASSTSLYPVKNKLFYILSRALIVVDP